MKNFLGSVQFKILIVILAILLGFMIAAVYTEGSASVLSNIVSTVTVPLQKLSSNISNSASEFFQKYTNSAALYEENKTLRGEVNDLRNQLADYNSIKHENEQFREIIGEMENRKDLTVKAASVISRDSAGRFYSFYIDKGSLDGVSYLDPVMTADGLVGYVSEVGTSFAKVVTILDVQVNTGSYNSSTRDIGVISGSVELAKDGLCQMELLPRDSETKEGDFILTSGALDSTSASLGGSLFPKDIFIGEVVRVEPDAHGTSLVAIIQPGADIPNVKNVFVITEFEGQGQK